MNLLPLLIYTLCYHTRKMKKTISKEEHIEILKNENFSRITLSFYKYVSIKDLSEMKVVLKDKLKELNCRGRIYIAKEGINAQMNVPTHNFNELDEFIQSIPEFRGISFKRAIEEKESSSFIKLHIRIRDRIVADGITDETFDASNTGEYVTAKEMNKHIENNGLVIDIRNSYETSIGHFKGAKCMNVDSFKEQISKLEKEFKDKKEEKIVLYCTGGIRCEKASAWMKHNGFKNVSHIRGGIIDYAQQVKDKVLPNYFMGKNFVFDERIAEKISDDVLTKCSICKVKDCDTFHNCANQTCNMLFISCKECSKERKGYCSRICNRLDVLPVRMKEMILRRNGKREMFKKRWTI